MTTLDTTFIQSINFDMMKEELLSYLLTLWDKDPVILGGIILVVFLIVPPKTSFNVYGFDMT